MKKSVETLEMVKTMFDCGYKLCYYYPPDWEYYKNLFDSVIIIYCEINKAKDYTFTLLAKVT